MVGHGSDSEQIILETGGWKMLSLQYGNRL